MQKTVKGFKAMHPDMTCRYFQFRLGETFKHKGEVIPCNSGFHFCQNIQNLNWYYDANCRIFEVEASGVIVEDDDKTVTDTLTIVREIDYNNYIDHHSAWVRAVVATQGIGLDILVNDDSWRVRRQIARLGYYNDQLKQDLNLMVRRAARNQRNLK